MTSFHLSNKAATELMDLSYWGQKMKNKTNPKYFPVVPEFDNLKPLSKSM